MDGARDRDTPLRTLRPERRANGAERVGLKKRGAKEPTARASVCTMQPEEDMSATWNRRDILKLAGLGGVVFASGLAGCAERAPTLTAAQAPGPAAMARARDFFFLQLSDTHWGFKGAPNPEA